MYRKHLIWLIIAAFLLAGCGRQAVPPIAPPDETVRAVWIPYMEMEGLLASDDPAAAVRACVRDCAARGINTLYLHVRANSDAYYPSSVYPQTASTEASGIDPLAVALEEAHRLGLSLHAWINPYRIGKDVTNARSQDVFCYEERWYYVPTAQSTHDLVVSGVRELTERYDIDGVQFDDYFYPVGAVEDAAPSPFEQETFAAYQAAGGALTVADWRRAAVSRLIGAVYAVCHNRDGCVFGVSPAADRQTVKERMYADTALWASTKGYVDYLCPQLYFGFEHETSPFLQELSDWSALRRHASVSLIAGLALYKTGLRDDPYAGSGNGEWATGGDLIARQFRLVQAAGWQGAALYSHLSFETDDTRDEAVVQKEIVALERVFVVDNGEKT
ncbi:MAG: hypothetical protein E7553_07315 [Ruminococcaceae bacterium]|nr:hypothetical protein [Oscillospiraceae bacterium]